MHRRGADGIIRRGGVAFFAAAVIALHVLHPELDLRSRAVSEYASTRTGWLMMLAFFGLAGALASAAFSFRTASRPIAVLLVVATVGLVVAGLFPADPWTSTEPSEAGLIHGIGTLLVFLGLLAVAFMAPRSLARTHGETPGISRRARLLAWVMLAGFVGFGVALAAQGQSGQGLAGLFQRVYITVLLAWVAFLPTGARR